jgi:choline dehydrogenase-like flavoprotein
MPESLEAVPEPYDPEPYDIVVIGSGIGGATLVNRLAPSGARILVLERGRRLEPSPQARDSTAIFLEGRFRPEETWRDSDGRPFNPGNYYCVGGNSKFYGAVMLRYREQDFQAQEFDDGLSPAWPFAYDELAPYYDQAERLYGVRGAAGEDPSEPPRAGPYPHPPVADEPSIAELRARLAALGLKPFSLPLAIDLDRWLAHGRTPWDAFPDTCGGKRDAETAALAPVLERSNVCLRTGVELRRLIAAPDGKRIESAEVVEAGAIRRIAAPLFVLSAGAVNSAAILLRSADGKNPDGLANSSDGVGRRFMNHNSAAVLAVNPWRRNDAVYQKTLGLNDFYLSDGAGGRPLGNMQLLGKVDGAMLKANLPAVPRPALDWLARRSVDWYVMSEDLPDPESRVRLDGAGNIVLEWRRNNMTAFNKLLAKAKEILGAAGYPLRLSRTFDRRTPSHQCGTLAMGNDPATAPLDPFCRTYDHPNLFVVDASFLPTSAAVNPALTIAAQALRVGDHIMQTELKS